MPSCPKKAVTLIELIIAITIVSVIILGINSISIFSHYHLISSDRRAKVQNDVSRCLEHMTKNLSRTIGNEAVFSANTAVYTLSAANAYRVYAFIDANANGLRDANPNDYWVAYTLDKGRNWFDYCSQYFDDPPTNCLMFEYLAKDITAFSVTKDFTAGNYITASITACWDPTATTAVCGTPDNPSVTMSTSIALPSVATN